MTQIIPQKLPQDLCWQEPLWKRVTKFKFFLNTDAVSLIRKPVLDSLVGLGTGKLSEHFDILVDANVPIYVSAISCEIRGVTEKDLEEANSIKVFPKTLLNLSLQSDRTFVY